MGKPWYEIKWESIDDELQRAKVFGGWLVRVDTSVSKFTPDGSIQDGWDWRPALTFVPDPNYEWEIKK